MTTMTIEPKTPGSNTPQQWSDGYGDNAPPCFWNRERLEPVRFAVVVCQPSLAPFGFSDPEERRTLCPPHQFDAGFDEGMKFAERTVQSCDLAQWLQETLLPWDDQPLAWRQGFMAAAGIEE